MPIIINEIVIKTQVEQPTNDTGTVANNAVNQLFADEIVQQAVEKVMEILEEKKHR